jgi:hypothetical protein
MNKVTNSNAIQSIEQNTNCWTTSESILTIFFMFVTPYQNVWCYSTEYDIFKFQRLENLKPQNSKCNRSKNLVAMTDDNDDDANNTRFILYRHGYEHVFTPSTWSQEIHGLSGKFPNVQNSPPLRRSSGARQVLLSSNEFNELRRENRIALSCLVIVLCFFM